MTFRNNNNTPNNFKRGPRFKSEATQQFENLIKDILQVTHDKNDIQVKYNSLHEMLIQANQHTYNLTQLLKHQPDFEQLMFSNDDILKYDTFLRDAKSSTGHIELDEDISEDRLKNMKNIFPHLSNAEMSAINAYTKNFWAPIYYLMKYEAQQPFPKTIELASNNSDLFSSLVGTLDLCAKKLYPDYDPGKLLSYELNDPIILTSLVKECLLLTSMAASALSKNLQLEIKVVTAKTYKDLENNLNNINGISLALIPNENSHEVADFVLIPREKAHDIVDDFVLIPTEQNELYYQLFVISFGKVVSQLPRLINLKELPNTEINLSTSEIQEILNEFNSEKTFNSFETIPELTKTKLLDILMNIDNVRDLMNEKIYHYEEDAKYFNETYIPDITKKMDKENSFQFIKSFCSTSSKPLDEFESSGINILTTFINPVGYVKNIESISAHPSEQERLVIPGQQVAYTKIDYKFPPNQNNTDDNVIYLESFPMRSIDGINPFSYSHEICLLRENVISLFDSIKQITPSIADVSKKETLLKWLDSMIITAANNQKTNERMPSKKFMLDLAEKLISCYLNIITSEHPSVATLFAPTISDTNKLAALIKIFIKDNFSVSLPSNIDEITNLSQVQISISEEFRKKANYTDDRFTFSLDNIKNAFVDSSKNYLKCSF